MSNYAARFVSGLVGNPEDRFSDVAAHIVLPVGDMRIPIEAWIAIYK